MDLHHDALREIPLESKLVDALIATSSQRDDKWAPRPVIITRAADMAKCRGMKMGFSPQI